jgi:hypothetical protein
MFPKKPPLPPPPPPPPPPYSAAVSFAAAGKGFSLISMSSATHSEM